MALPLASTKETPVAVVRRIDSHRKLMAAVLQTVIDDCRGTRYRQKAHPETHVGARGVRKAIAYIESTDRAWPFSFENLCDALGFDADSVRQQFEKGITFDGTTETSDPV